MNDSMLYFSDYFNVDKEIIDSYEAINISLVCDLPLFIDPFLLFNSNRIQYQQIHKELINYILFLQQQSELFVTPPKGILESWFTFSEVKQTWLGFSKSGNSGRGLGKTFALELFEALKTTFKDFGKEKITKSSHLEKLCLISPKVGKDKISDFTTNFVKSYLLIYTSEFAEKYIDKSKCKKFNVPKVYFNYETKTWCSKEFLLPCYNNDYVLLTPKNILTKDDTFINRSDMIDKLEYLASSIENEALRFQLNYYLKSVLEKKKSEISKVDKEHFATEMISEHPEIIDFYIKMKEEHGDDAKKLNDEAVKEVENLLIKSIPILVDKLKESTAFYKNKNNSYDETMNRVKYLKHVIENMDGYKIFYANDNQPIKRESILQIMFRLVWYPTGLGYDVNREVNNGRGPADYKISFGNKDSTIVEFKLASNSKLKQNLENQIEIYKRANKTKNGIEVILFFTDSELTKVIKVLNDLDLSKDPSIILIDARKNKTSASNVK